MKLASKIAGSLLIAASFSSFATDMGAIVGKLDGFDPTDAATLSDLANMATDSATSMIIQLSAVPGSAYIQQDTTNPNVAVIYQNIQTGGTPAFAAIYQPASAIGNVAVVNQK